MRARIGARRLGVVLLATVALLAVAAPLVAPHDPREQFANCLHAPPMPLHLRDQDGRWHWPFHYPLRLVSRLESRYEEIREVRKADGAPVCQVWLPLGASIGGVAGYFGGAVDEGVMRLAEFVLVLPTVYLVLALRALMPLVMAPVQIFALMAGIFTLIGWPWVARGVRGIAATERARDYVEAARAAGAGHGRILFRHILPAAFGHLGVQGTLLVPAFILAEATLSFVGLGFPDPTPTWGTMLQDATNVSTLAQFPWMLSPAAAVFVVVLAVNLATDRSAA